VNKRAIAILGAIFILIVGTLGVLIYLRSKKTTTEPVAETAVPVVSEPSTEPTAPEASSSAAVRLTDAGDPVISPIIFYTGVGISYFNTNGQLFQTDLQVSNKSAVLSNKKELSIALKPNITQVIWPPAGNGFMAQFGTDAKPTWSYYNTPKGTYTDLPPQIYSFDWMPGGDKIMFVWVDANGKATLNLSDPDSSNYTTLTDLYEPDNIISVAPDGKNVLFYRTQTTDNTKNPINIVSADGKTFNTIVKDGYNTGVLWSPDSKKFLYTKRDSGTQKFALWVADIATGATSNLGVYTPQTKAVWTKDGLSVFVGEPGNTASGLSLTQDTIKKINIATGSIQEFAPGISVDVRDMFFSSDESILFFRNAQDNALYYIPVQ
jgi:Tol biopolymer transport system component